MKEIKQNKIEMMEELFHKTQKKFPEIEFVDYSVSPDDPEHLWVNVKANMEDDREIELEHFVAQLEADIDSEYGCRISIMLENQNYVCV